MTNLGFYPFDCLDYRLAASLVESIGGHYSFIGETLIKLNGTKIEDKLLQLILKIHKTVYAVNENAMKAVFYHDISVGLCDMKVKVNNIFHEIETGVLDVSPEMGSHILTVASSIIQIYDNSLDIAALEIPKRS